MSRKVMALHSVSKKAVQVRALDWIAAKSKQGPTEVVGNELTDEKNITAAATYRGFWMNSSTACVVYWRI
jgi:hypothetical protein